MIIFFPHYPSDELCKYGMYRRIRDIDALFADQERLYVYPEFNPQGDYRIPKPVRINDKVSSQALDFRYAAHNLRMAELVVGADLLYAHTTGFSARYITPYLSSGKVICDAHGIVTEEYAMAGQFSCARFCDPLEGLLLRDSAHVVVVTRAMEDFYKKKYGLTHSRFILLPIHTSRQAPAVSRRPRRAAIQVIYAGGSQAWQNVDLMLEAVRNYPGEAEFIFLSADANIFREKVAALDLKRKTNVATAAVEDMPGWYARTDFGFVLRDDDPVNAVACPTKLIEYMSSGVIPIIKTGNMGDFKHYGLEAVAIEEFSRGEIPDYERRAAMAEKNFRIVSKIVDDYEQGTRDLLSIAANMTAGPKTAVSSAQYPTLIRNAVFPAFFIFTYTGDGVEREKVVDRAEYPIELILEFERPVTLTRLALNFSGHQCVLAPPSASFTGVQGYFTGPCLNSHEYPQTSYGDLFYRNGLLSFACPDWPVARVSVALDVKLYELEASGSPAGQDAFGPAPPFEESRLSVLARKSWLTLRREGPLSLGRKIWRKLKAAL